MNSARPRHANTRARAKCNRVYNARRNPQREPLKTTCKLNGAAQTSTVFHTGSCIIQTTAAAEGLLRIRGPVKTLGIKINNMVINNQYELLCTREEEVKRKRETLQGRGETTIQRFQTVWIMN